MDSRKPWICDRCGEVATGDLCAKCGTNAPLGPSDPADPLAMGTIIGMPRTSLAVRMAILLWLGPALFLIVAALGYAACNRPQPGAAQQTERLSDLTGSE